MTEEKEDINRIVSIEDYIKKISKLIRDKDDEITVVYRGEDEIYPVPCQPNIFRGNYLKRNRFFEKNLFDEMRANDLTDGNTYLEKAIDAQHGGFPSRLLDVTYNSLVALYFAVTPDTKFEEGSKDGAGKDGAVYVYFIKKIFCPSGQNTNSTYDSIVTREKPWLCEHEIFQRNHKLIDHIRKNKRVIAQQGAFMLFQGDSIKPIPEYDYERFTVDGSYKELIRKNLKELFGIHTGSIYPEAGNLIIDMVSKSMKVSTEKFEFNTELGMVMNTLEWELNIFYKKIIQMISSNDNEEKILEEINSIERKIYEYKFEYKELYRIDEHQDILEKYGRKYNEILELFFKNISSYIHRFGIEFSKDELLMGEYR